VTVVAGVTSVQPPRGVRIISVASADQMHRAVTEEMGDATVFIGAAAVSDYRVKNKSDEKIKKSSAEIELQLERTPDILADVARSRRNGQLVIGFAAETNDLLKHAREKLTRKNLDAVVANDVSRADAGFDSENNAAVILLRDRAEPLELPLMPKLDVANRILDEVVRLRHASSSTEPPQSKVAQQPR